MTSRRKFIQLTTGGILAVGAGYIGLNAFASFEHIITNILYSNLSGLKIKTGDIERFAQKAAATNPWGFNEKKKRLMGLYGHINSLPLPFIKEYKLYRDEIVSRFLLSTDFFVNKMDENREIAYRDVIWGPYTTPCLNPFSAMFYPAA